MATLDYVARTETTTKKDLIAFGGDEALPFIENYDSTEPKGKYRLLDSRILGPLREKGYVELEGVGRTKRVSITEDGRNTLQAFRYLID